MTAEELALIDGLPERRGVAVAQNETGVAITGRRTWYETATDKVVFELVALGWADTLENALAAAAAFMENAEPLPQP